MYEILLRPPQRLTETPAPSFWLNPFLMHSVAEMSGTETLQLLCFKGETLMAAMPLYERTAMRIKRLIAPVGAYYQGISFFNPKSGSSNRQLLDELHICEQIARFLKGRYLKISFNLNPDNYDVRGFTWSGLKAKPLYTFIHRLPKPVSPLRDERSKIKRAQAENYSFTEEFYPEQFIEMQKNLLQRKRYDTGITYARLLAWIKTLHQDGLLMQFNLKRGDRIISANIVLGDDGDTAYTVLRATCSEGLKTGASSLHSVLLIQALKDRYCQLDFCGANLPEVARFKAAFGFELKLFFQIHS